ncbi:MAG: hypothetical protein ACRDQA_08560 [Nocardioidaceae bacterium]
MPIIADPNAPAPTPPETSTGIDGVLTAYLDPAWAGVLLVARFGSGVSRVRFWRGDTLVRSGDWAAAPGGIAVAYDHEAPLGGTGNSWHAEADTGVISDPVGLVIVEPSDLSRVWLKSIDNPVLSATFVVSTWPELTYAARRDVSPLVGSAYPAISTDIRQAATSTMTIWTSTAAEAESLHTLVDSGVLLLQPTAETHRGDSYISMGDLVQADAGVPQNQQRLWTLPLTSIARPATTDQRLRVPGRSYADRYAKYPTYGDVPTRTYLGALIGS